MCMWNKDMPIQLWKLIWWKSSFVWNDRIKNWHLYIHKSSVKEWRENSFSNKGIATIPVEASCNLMFFVLLFFLCVYVACYIHLKLKLKNKWGWNCFENWRNNVNLVSIDDSSFIIGRGKNRGEIRSGWYGGWMGTEIYIFCRKLTNSQGRLSKRKQWTSPWHQKRLSCFFGSGNHLPIRQDGGSLVSMSFPLSP